MVLTRLQLMAVATFVAALLGAGCSEEGVFGPSTGVHGSGNMVTESRQVSDFDEIVVLGSGEVLLDVTGTESLLIEAEDNIMPLLTSQVRDGRLELGSDSSFSATRGITYTITAADLVGVVITGNGDVNGSGIDTDSFLLSITGSGKVDLAGTSDDLVVEIAGSGDFDGGALESATGRVTVAGSGDVLVNVTDDLRIIISGSGDVEYMGDPILHETISGSGNVSRR